MPEKKRTPRATRKKSQNLSEHEKHERKQRVLTKGAPSMVRSIADAVVVKDEEVFLLTQPDSQVPLESNHGFGLYYHDCRFLKGYELRLGGAEPDVLVSDAARGFMAAFELTNPDIRMEDGHLIPKEHIGIRWERMIDGARRTLNEVITFQNVELQQVEVPVSLTFQAEFEDIFAVRGMLPERPGKLRQPSWKGNALSFIYEGKDDLYRSLVIYFSPTPQKTEGTTAHFRINLGPRESRQLLISLVISESPDLNEVQPKARAQPDHNSTKASLSRSVEEWLGLHTKVHSDSLLLNKTLERSLRDLRILRTHIAGQEFIAAGVPWFVTLFGRDSLIAALQTLAFQPGIAEQTLRVLAGYQGQQVNDWKDEEPGKILHELRIGEMARLGEVPYTPYYGTVDATPLFLILIGRHAAWTGDLTVFKELRSHIERALDWMSHYGDQNGDGYIEYKSSSEKGLINQGWKDSGDAIVNDDGRLATPPISLVEVQGYVYLAKIGLADLYQRVGEPDRADQLRREAEDLRTRFNRDFWLEDKGFYALALQADNKPVAVISSNPGQALWSGIADPDKAQRTMERLMAEDMFSGWGIRTLSDKERRYNPIGYHLGTVWPHDNAIIAAGFRRYGFNEAAQRIFTTIVEAAMYFNNYRLPELFAGFPRTDYSVPVRYPVACHPQAWAAGSVPYLIETSLGLIPEAFDRRLRIVRPILPDFLDRMDLYGLKVGDAQVDLGFERSSKGNISVQVLKIEGPLNVIVEP